MGRLEENPVPPQSIQTPPPEGYPNQFDNPPTSQEPIRSTPSQQPPAAAYPQPVAYPPPPAAYPPPAATYAQPAAYSQPPATTYVQPATYPQPPATVYAQPAAYPSHSTLGANGSTSDPKINSYTPNYNCQPHVTTSTPNSVQPPMAMNPQEWSTGLLECYDDPGNAIMTLCFPCVTFGQIAEILDNGQTSCATSGLIYSLIQAFIGIPCIVSCSYRTKIRSRYNLFETPAPDFVVHLFCEYCALCQEYRELKNRGMDPALGWQGNLSKHQQMANVATMTPPVNQRMMG